MNERGSRTAVFAAVAGISLGGLLAIRHIQAGRARSVSECAALTKALDKTIRARSPRYFEGIVEHRWDAEKGRCLASLEYHYKPCDAVLQKKTPLLCSGPDADIAIYTFLQTEAHPLYICERTYATNEASCTDSVYGSDGSLLSSREFPPEHFPAIKTELFPSKP